MTNYPKWFLPALLWTLLLMFASGLLLAPTTLAMRTELEVAWRLPGAGRIAVAALHAAGGFALMLLMGALWSVHMRSGWRRRKQRLSGVLLGSWLIVLTLSAVAVYYVGEDTLGRLAALTHLVLGLALLVPFLVHWLRGRRVRRRAAMERLARLH